MSETSSSKDYAKERLFDQLLNSIDESSTDSSEEILPLGKWAESMPIVLDGKLFSFVRHEYLKTPYADDHPHQVEMKSTQMGCTTRAILKALYAARYRGFKGILYLFPSRTDVLDFSKSRISPLIDENPDSLARWIRETDSAGLKAIWSAWLYLRGMQSAVGLKSVPVDLVVFDEIDEGPQKAVDLALERMAHSEFKEVHKLSNPTLPDYGIDKAFQETDQRYWLLKCPSCNHFTCLEDTFPSCLIEVGDRVIRACEKCHSELDPSRGEWVAKKPGVTDKRGYHYSQLFSQFVYPGDILHGFRTTNNLQAFWNLKIGNAYVEAENRLSIAEILALCGDDGIASEDRGPCSMGIDQGKDLHVCIGKRHPGKRGKIIHLGVYKDWNELDRLMKNFNVFRAVCDGLPEQRNARNFAERHKGRAFLSFYNVYQRNFYKWDEEQLTVLSNRTECLDASHNEVMRGDLVLPKNCEIVREFAKHLHNVAKKLEEDKETGSKRYKYVKLGPDHFRHALNYEAMARQFGASGFFRDCEL